MRTLWIWRLKPKVSSQTHAMSSPKTWRRQCCALPTDVTRLLRQEWIFYRPQASSQRTAAREVLMCHSRHISAPGRTRISGSFSMAESFESLRLCVYCVIIVSVPLCLLEPAMLITSAPLWATSANGNHIFQPHMILRTIVIYFTSSRYR